MILFWGFLLYIFLRKCNMTKLQSLEINCYFLQVGESSSADFRCQLSSAGGLADSILLILLASLIGACYFAASCFVTHHHPILFNLFALFLTWTMSVVCFVLWAILACLQCWPFSPCICVHLCVSQSHGYTTVITGSLDCALVPSTMAPALPPTLYRLFII